MQRNIQFINTYDLAARIAPATIAFAPMMIGILILINRADIWEFSFLVAVLLFVFSTPVRDAGKSVEGDIFENEQQPIASFIMYTGKQANKYYISDEIKKACHEKIKKIIKMGKKEIWLPQTREEEEEKMSEKNRNSNYEIAASCMIDIMRDKNKWEIIYDKNVRFGYHRNLYAMKNTAMGLDILVLIVLTFSLYIILFSEPYNQISNIFTDFFPICDSSTACVDDNVKPILYLYFLGIILHFLYFKLHVSEKKVEESAYQYAKYLMINLLYYEKVKNMEGS